MKIIDEGTVYSTAKDNPFKSLCFSEICVLESGRWICSFRSGISKNGRIEERILITWTDDEGITWSKPICPFNNMFVNKKFGGFRYMGLTPVNENVVLGSLCWTEHTYMDNIPLMSSENEGGLLENTMLITLSEDGCETWSYPYAPMLDKTFKGPKGFSTSSLYLPSGEIMWTYELYKGYYDKAPYKHKVVAMISKDMGGTWDTESVVVEDENRYYWDHRESVLDDGRILMFFWTNDIINRKYLNIHAVESQDNGRSWSEPWDTEVSVQPARPVSLKDGRVAMVYIDRKSSPAIKIKISENKGKTFDEKTEFTIFDSNMKRQMNYKKDYGDTIKEFSSYSIGLPRTALLRNGDILVSYYIGVETDITGIGWSRIRIE